MKLSNLTRNLIALSLAASAVGAFAAGNDMTGMKHAGHGGPDDMQGMNGMRPHGPMTAEMAQKFAERRVERVAKLVNATPEQKAKLLAIAQTEGKEMMALHGKQDDFHKRKMELIGAPTLDRVAIQKLDAEHAASKSRMMAIREKAQLDGLEVLSSTQRVTLMQKMKTHMDKKDGQPGHQGKNHPQGDKNTTPPAK